MSAFAAASYTTIGLPVQKLVGAIDANQTNIVTNGTAITAGQLIQSMPK